VRKLAVGVGLGLLVAVACGAPSRPGELGSMFSPTRDAGPDVGPLTLLPVVAASDDPTTCDQAAMIRSYVGCDYWPTVVANPVWSIFDFAVVVANAGTQPAQVTITGPGGIDQSQTVAPNTLAKFYLPWVKSLKGDDCDVCGDAPPLSASVVAPGAAYHLVSSVPVTVYQFNALEYAAIGGPPGKDWAGCPGSSVCNDGVDPPQPLGCFSFTNDSSLLLPSTAMTGHYRVTGYHGATLTKLDGTTTDTMGGYFAITALTNGTHVKVALASAGAVVASAGAPEGGTGGAPTAGGGDDAGDADDAGEAGASSDAGSVPYAEAGSPIAATPGGGELALTLNAGDVVEIAGVLGNAADLSGSLVAADQPVQVIAGTPCSEVQTGTPACDHLEQSVFPAETLGKHYFVTAPTGPGGVAAGRVVRFYGNVDGTTLTYAPAVPAGCPTTLDAGQVADCGVVSGDFEVSGSNEFAVGSFMQGGSVVDPSGGLGDPSESLMASVEQYRTKYVFLAPGDYEENFADLVVPAGTNVVLDGTPLNLQAATPIADGYGVLRLSLDGVNIGGGGAHVLTSSAPIGVQVLGYGEFTSYQYPAGLNLKQIAPPPPNPP
jgi:hypothetical protein